MNKYNLNDCFEKGLLRDMPPSTEKADGSIKAAERWITESEKDINGGTFNSSVLASYLAMFHSARAILFFNGLREKSHYCIARYLEEQYVKKDLLDKKWIELLDHYRELRHGDQYDISFFSSKDEAVSALRIAREFTEQMRLLLQKLERTAKKH